MDEFIDTAKYIVNNKKKPKLKNIAYRAVFCSVYSILCLPCYCWSITWRCLACPFQCCYKGPLFICSNNNCTTVSDLGISSYIKATNEEISFRDVDITLISRDDLLKILSLIDFLEKTYVVVQPLAETQIGQSPVVEKYDKMHYILCETIVRPLTSNIRVLPNTTLAVLEHFKIKINLCINTSI